MAIFNSYVSLPEGIYYDLLVFSHLRSPPSRLEAFAATVPLFPVLSVAPKLWVLVVVAGCGPTDVYFFGSYIEPVILGGCISWV